MAGGLALLDLLERADRQRVFRADADAAVRDVHIAHRLEVHHRARRVRRLRGLHRLSAAHVRSGLTASFLDLGGRRRAAGAQRQGSRDGTGNCGKAEAGTGGKQTSIHKVKA